MLLGPAPVLGAVAGSPALSINLAENELTPGTDEQLQFTLSNEGNMETGSVAEPDMNSRVTTARGIDVTMAADDAPIQIRTEKRTLGSLPSGKSAPVAFAVSVPADASPGTYDVSVDVAYTYTSYISEKSGSFTERTERDNFKLSVDVQERAAFDVVSSSDDVRIGESGTVTVTLQNVGTAAAHDATVALESRNGVLSVGGQRRGTRFVGEWEPGENRTVSFDVAAARSAQRQRYAFDVGVNYDDADDHPQQSKPTAIGVVPQTRQFTVVETDEDLHVGDTGTVDVTLRNDGEAAVHGATVRLDSPNTGLRVQGAASGERFVGEWEAGENRTASFDVGVAKNASPHRYALHTTVNFVDDSGDELTSRPLSLGVTPAARSLELTGGGGTLEVGRENEVTGSIRNDGPGTVHDAVVVLSTAGSGVSPQQPEYALGTLEAGTRRNFSFTVPVSDDTEPGQRQFTYRVRYQNADGDEQVSGALNAQATLGDSPKRFGVRVNRSEIEPGSTGEVSLLVTNNGTEAVRNVDVRAFTEAPLSFTDDRAFVSALEPGETAEVSMQLQADDDAIPKSYPISVDFQYQTSDGETKLSDTHRLGVSLVESAGGTNVTVGFAGIASMLTLAVFGIGWYRR
ncbi:NEW3 domain-containing protein [Haloarculaceae archaeon H-GB2-1]|nr:NEW3 domain-containing protein [Haloarculaceae archaeon H-GB11]MEA5407112.1 NEW3 domain-containing protein [Haloarculaceae archaeon H-GB2-1]